MSICVISANLGAFDAPYPETRIEQIGMGVDYHHFTDANYPPRPNALHPRMQAKIPKMFGWDLLPGYDIYFWLDASLAFAKPDSAYWFIGQMGCDDLAIFEHPWRETIHQEADYLRRKLAHRSPYMTPRYAGEDLDGALAAIDRDTSYKDNRLFAAGAFCYRPTDRIKQAMTDWWLHVSRYHVNDQLSLPYVLRHCQVAVQRGDIFNTTHLKWTRKRGHG